VVNILGGAASILAWFGFVRVIRAAVITVKRAIPICVDIRGATTAHAPSGFIGIIRTTVFTVETAVTIGVEIGNATTADTGFDFVRIVWTVVNVFGISAIVGLREAASVYPWLDLVRVIRTAVITVESAIPI